MAEEAASGDSITSNLPEHHTALFYREYGTIDKMKVDKLPLPQLVLPTDVLIRVHAASINPADVKQRSGELKLLVNRTMPVTIGFDFSGVIVKLGADNGDFEVGDEVFGDVLGVRTGSCAEYLVVDSRVIVRKPASLTHVQAAGAPLAGITALQCFEACHFERGGRVLITGGAGGVGSYAIQIAKGHYNASFIATTASAGKMGFVKCLGADAAYDYKATGDEEYVAKCMAGDVYFDCIIDCTGEAWRLRKLVRPGGGLASILVCPTSEMLNKWAAGSMGPGMSISPIIVNSIWGLGSTLNCFTGARSIINYLGEKGATFKNIITMPNKEVMVLLCSLLESKAVVPQIDSEYDLYTEALEAVKKLEGGRATGKVIVKCI